ncbi:MAG: hypothetical protein AAF907_08300 [Planctomycetota bacterium]
MLIFLGFLAFTISVLLIGAWSWMMADVLRHEPNDGPDKLLWAFAVLLFWPLSGAYYFFVRRPERLREYGE